MLPVRAGLQDRSIGSGDKAVKYCIRFYSICAMQSDVHEHYAASVELHLRVLRRRSQALRQCVYKGQPGRNDTIQRHGFQLEEICVWCMRVARMMIRPEKALLLPVNLV